MGRDAWTLRASTLEDAGSVAAIRLRSGRAAYRGLVPDAYLAAQSVVTLAEQARQSVRAAAADPVGLHLLACRGATPVAFLHAGTARDADAAGLAEVYALYADPEHWSTGAGRALLGAALEALPPVPVVLWVLAGNARARRFYAAAGFAPDGAAATLDVGTPVRKVRYERQPSSSSSSSPTVSPGRAGTERTASSTPGMNDARSNES